MYLKNQKHHLYKWCFWFFSERAVSFSGALCKADEPSRAIFQQKNMRAPEKETASDLYLRTNASLGDRYDARRAGQ